MRIRKPDPNNTCGIDVHRDIIVIHRDSCMFNALPFSEYIACLSKEGKTSKDELDRVSETIGSFLIYCEETLGMCSFRSHKPHKVNYPVSPR